MKSQMRILGIDDSPFEKSQAGEQVLVVGTIFRGKEYLDGLMSTTVTIDGLDATKQLIKMINNSRNKAQLKAIMLDGFALGGFNIIDIKELNKTTKLPVIVVIRNMPDFIKIRAALNNFADKDIRLERMEQAGKIHEFPVNHKELGREGKKIYYQISGISKSEAEDILNLTITHGLIPEPIRVAHIITSGISKGESKGRA